MKEIIVAFDIDGTLLNNEGISPATPPHLRPQTSVNLDAIILLQIFAKKMKNTKVYVWSGGGQKYAEDMVRRYGLERYVDRCFGKQEYEEELYGRVDICFDDVHACELADKNLIVRMK